jgi:hypothetical protein
VSSLVFPDEAALILIGTSAFFYFTLLSAFGNGYLTQASVQIPFAPSSNASPSTNEKAAASETHDWNFDLQSLEPVELAVNGDSKNRVDLVYFGDGCTHFGLEIDMRTDNSLSLQIPKLNVTPSSVMPNPSPTLC